MQIGSSVSSSNWEAAMISRCVQAGGKEAGMCFTPAHRNFSQTESLSRKRPWFQHRKVTPKGIPGLGQVSFISDAREQIQAELSFCVMHCAHCRRDLQSTIWGYSGTQESILNIVQMWCACQWKDWWSAVGTEEGARLEGKGRSLRWGAWTQQERGKKERCLPGRLGKDLELDVASKGFKGC